MSAFPFARSQGASAILIALAFVSGAKATATPPSSDLPSRVVRYGDLNLATDAGAATLRLRAHRAVSDLFETAPSDSLASRMTAQRAEQEALARADAQVTRTVEQARSGVSS